MVVVELQSKSNLSCNLHCTRPAIAFGCLQFTRKLNTEFRGVNSAMGRENVLVATINTEIPQNSISRVF